MTLIPTPSINGAQGGKGPLSLWRPEMYPETMIDVARRVAAAHGLTLGELQGLSRARRFSWPRQEAMAQMRAIGKWSLPQIGRFFGMDHTTILHGISAHQRREAGLPPTPRPWAPTKAWEKTWAQTCEREARR